jgi:hypothetical protein
VGVKDDAVAVLQNVADVEAVKLAHEDNGHNDWAFVVDFELYFEVSSGSEDTVDDHSAH